MSSHGFRTPSRTFDEPVRVKRWTVDPTTLRLVISVEGLLSMNRPKYSSKLVWDYAKDDNRVPTSEVIWQSSKRLSLAEVVEEYQLQLDRMRSHPQPIVVTLDWGIVPINTMEQSQLDAAWRAMANGPDGITHVASSGPVIDKVCDVCASPFTARRRHARVCSDNGGRLLRRSA